MDKNTPLPVATMASYGACDGRTEKEKDGKGATTIAGLMPNGSLRATCGGSSGRNSTSPSEESEAIAAQKSLLQRADSAIPCLGIILALFASVFLGSAGMLVKMTTSVHGIQVAVFRAMIQLAVYGTIISVRGLSCLPSRGELGPVMGRALLGATSITFSYYALKLIPLGDATTIRFSLPIWTLIVSYLVLGESCNAFKVGAVVVSISGVVLIAKPETCVFWLHVLLHWLGFESEEQYVQEVGAFRAHRAELELAEQDGGSGGGGGGEQHRQLEGSLLALSSSICLALSLIALRLCRRTSAEITILWLSICSILLGSGALVALNEWRLPNNWTDVLYILLNGLCGSIGQWCITSALKIEQSGVISLARTFDIEVAFLYSAFLLHEHIRVTSVIGSVLVSCGVVAVVVPKWLGSRCSDTTTTDDNNSTTANHPNDDNDNDDDDDAAARRRQPSQRRDHHEAGSQYRRGSTMVTSTDDSNNQPPTTLKC